MTTNRHRRATWCAIGLLVLPSLADAASDTSGPATSDSTEVQEAPRPKFIWGLLLNLAFKYAMSAFTDWLESKLTTNLSSPSSLQKLLFNSRQAVIVPLSSISPTKAKSAGAVENVTTREATTPLTVENGRENYQAVHVAIVGFDRDGNVTTLKPVTAGFKTGERFKLKVLPTFDGILVIENINPKGEKRQIFPPDEANVVSVQRGMEVFVPMSEDYYFEFTKQTGDEQLVITIRDPRAFGEAASQVKASRRDDKSGSSFVQETVSGTYPVISQSLTLAHGQ